MTFIPRQLQLIFESIISGAPVLDVYVGRSGVGPSLSINADEMYKLAFSTHNIFSGTCRYKLFFNADNTLANYSLQSLGADAGVLTPSRITSQTSILHLASGDAGYCEVYIVKDVDNNVRCLLPYINEKASVQTGFGGILYAPGGGVADVTSIDIISIDDTSGSPEPGIDIGSTTRLYRLSPI